MPDAINQEPGPGSRSQFCRALIFLCAGLIIAGWVNRHALNPDGVAYLRAASYYAEGKFDLAVSGYWAPLLSWLLVPWLKLGIAPLVAARIVMGGTAVFFLFGCRRLFHRFELRGHWLTAGIWSAAMVAVSWSVENITPDLLAAGLIGFALGELVDERWWQTRRAAVAVGLWWGAAFLAKAVALPLGILTIAGIAIAWHRARPGEFPRLARSCTVTLAVAVLVAAPWIGILSAKYGGFTFSRSAQLNHAMVGPADVERFYPFDRGLQSPPPGRVTFWEDQEMPYADWSPFASARNFILQLQIVRRNLPGLFIMLTSVSLAAPLIMAALLWRGVRRRADGLNLRLWQAALPVAVIGALYLPGNLLISEQRYFYLVFPLLYIAGAMLLAASAASWRMRYGPLLLALAMILPTWGRGWLRSAPNRTAGDCAWDIAARLTAHQLGGPVAGSAMLPGGRTGLYVAYLMGQPWHGDPRNPTADSFQHSGVSLIIVKRASSLAQSLGENPDFQDLDGQLFNSPGEAARCPVQVFRNPQAVR